MITKSRPDEIQSYLTDASNMQGGHAVSVVFPEETEEIAEMLAEATRARLPVTIAGAGTGIVGGRVPFGGIVLATDRLNRIKDIVPENNDGWAVAEAGVVLGEFQRAVEARGLFYPPDPTEWSCFLGGTVATNASGSRTFKYGPTRNYIRRLKIVLATGDVLDLRRGQIYVDDDGKIRIPLKTGRPIEAQLPTYRMPRTRKHASGYYIAPNMDAIDLFIGSEGSLGVVTEVETSLLLKPEGLLAGIVFFNSEDDLLGFVQKAKELSLQTRRGEPVNTVAARSLEYFDDKSLNFLRRKFTQVPEGAAGAIYFEQEITAAIEEESMTDWLTLLESEKALVDDSWFATNEHDLAQMRDFRHQLPMLINEWLSQHNQRKISTDMAVSDETFPEMLGFYKETLQANALHYVIFGHIGDNHVHVNILPLNENEDARARDIYGQFIRRALQLGGTVSAEHGIGKLKRDFLVALYGDEHLREMAALKRAFDPACILGRGNIFGEEYL